MENNILPDFQKFLLSRGFTPAKNVPFYANWVSKFIAFSNRHEEVNHDLLFEEFLDKLKSQENIADWQIRQAEDALCNPSFNERSEYQGDTEFTGSQAC
jgi:hypothetical protein